MSKRIIYTGTIIVDLVMYVEQIPQVGGDTISKDTLIQVGGGLNALLAAKRNGAQVLYCGLIGQGQMGKIISDTLAREKVSVLYEPVTEDNGFCVALVDKNAQRTFITHLGAEDLWGISHAQMIPLKPEDLVYVSGYSLVSPQGVAGIETLISRLHPSNILVFDPSPLISELPRENTRAVLSRANIISLNATEAKYLSKNSHLEAAIKQLKQDYPQAEPVVRNGEHGTLILSSAGEALSIPAPKVKAVDTSGAGDTHVGVMMALLGAGESLEAAVTRANIAAAIKVTRYGSAASPTDLEIDTWIEEMEKKP